MPVIINEFEIVVEPPKQAEADVSASRKLAPSATRLSPRDIQLLLDFQRQRNLRVTAH